jgi:hypothetical protein
LRLAGMAAWVSRPAWVSGLAQELGWKAFFLF